MAMKGKELKNAMAYHGTISEFQPTTEDVSYTERLQCYFDANEITDAAKKRAILLTACGLPTLKLIKGLIGADKVKTTAFDVLVKSVTQYHVPMPLSIDIVSTPVFVPVARQLLNTSLH